MISLSKEEFKLSIFQKVTSELHVSALKGILPVLSHRPFLPVDDDGGAPLEDPLWGALHHQQVPDDDDYDDDDDDDYDDYDDDDDNRFIRLPFAIPDNSSSIFCFSSNCIPKSS